MRSSSKTLLLCPLFLAASLQSKSQQGATIKGSLGLAASVETKSPAYKKPIQAEASFSLSNIFGTRFLGFEATAQASLAGSYVMYESGRARITNPGAGPAIGTLTAGPTIGKLFSGYNDKDVKVDFMLGGTAAMTKNKIFVYPSVRLKFNVEVSPYAGFAVTGGYDRVTTNLAAYHPPTGAAVGPETSKTQLVGSLSLYLHLKKTNSRGGCNY